MSKEVTPSNFKPIKSPDYHYTRKLVEKKTYLDKLYTKEWLDNYFCIDEKSRDKKSRDKK